ncbi:YycH family regulatory protein [Aeribacillus pallidus]|jgi:Uncharacterized protein conserved in bacteria|uniref:Regulatory protein YycH domain-containing protein n=1 Tax=Aeribacillus pallidus TaxID=33936 RepID=A0A165Y0E6_9BACI|nr:two-component system activity regulator YycH [Aeribacillus pallidus]KZN96592.1 hypothetical protein AZI98_08055 [Aeribacillus pallidus]
MNRETIKSIILTFLVLTSLFFTWNIWTYQPNYGEISNSNYIENNPLSNVTKKPYEVVQPDHIMIHEKIKHYATYDEIVIERLWKDIRQWELEEFKNISGEIEKQYGFNQWINREIHNLTPNFEIIFNDSIPMSALLSITDWTDEGDFNIEFDRIYIPLTNEKSNRKIYLVDYEHKYVVEAQVKTVLSNLWTEVYKEKENFESYVFWNGLFLPEKPFPIHRLQFFTKSMSGEQFKNALFNDPSYVKRDVNASEFVYTDSSRQLVINEDKERVVYVNPTIDQSLTTEKGKLILQSIDFLNKHGGWLSGLNDYRFEKTDQEQKIYFRLTVRNLPVFSFSDSHYSITTIMQSWGKNDIALYQRPLFYLDDFIREDKTILPGAADIIEAIKDSPSIEADKIKRIFPAYDIQQSSRQNIVNLEPIWCIELENDKYQRLNVKKAGKGGEGIGLE